MFVGHGGPDLPGGERFAGELVQDILDGADSWCWPGSPFARRRPGRFGECLADHAAVNVVTAGDLPDGQAAGGVIADDAEQPGLAGRRSTAEPGADAGPAAPPGAALINYERAIRRHAG